LDSDVLGDVVRAADADAAGFSCPAVGTLRLHATMPLPQSHSHRAALYLSPHAPAVQRTFATKGEKSLNPGGWFAEKSVFDAGKERFLWLGDWTRDGAKYLGLTRPVLELEWARGPESSCPFLVFL
jgi:hypothetical protein